MCFNPESWCLDVVRNILCFSLLWGLGGCSADQDSHKTNLPVFNQTSASPKVETIMLEETIYQRSLRFHGVVKGSHSFSESVFEPGKIVSLNIKEGQKVVKGEVIVTLYSPVLAEKLAQAQAVLDKNKAQLKLSRETLARRISLFRKNLLPEQQIDEAERDFGIAMHNVQEAEAAVSQASNEFSSTSIQAREAGVIAAIYKREGDFINPGEGVFKFESVAGQKASFSIPENQAVDIQMGDRYPVYVPSLDQEFEGLVSEKSLPTTDGVRLHRITLEFDEGGPILVGLRVELEYVTDPIPAYRVDHRSVRYDLSGRPYILMGKEQFQPFNVSILDMQKDSILLTGDFDGNIHVLVGNTVSVPVNLHRF